MGRECIPSFVAVDRIWERRWSIDCIHIRHIELLTRSNKCSNPPIYPFHPPISSMMFLMFLRIPQNRFISTFRTRKTKLQSTHSEQRGVLQSDQQEVYKSLRIPQLSINNYPKTQRVGKVPPRPRTMTSANGINSGGMCLIFCHVGRNLPKNISIKSSHSSLVRIKCLRE